MISPNEFLIKIKCNKACHSYKSIVFFYCHLGDNLDAAVTQPLDLVGKDEEFIDLS
jgi:hypothetical protein